MKKILSLTLGFLIAVAMLLPCFSFALKIKNEDIAYANVEDKYYTSNAFDLISRNPNSSISNGGT